MHLGQYIKRQRLAIISSNGTNKSIAEIAKIDKLPPKFKY